MAARAAGAAPALSDRCGPFSQLSGTALQTHRGGLTGALQAPEFRSPPTRSMGKAPAVRLGPCGRVMGATGRGAKRASLALKERSNSGAEGF